MRAASSQQAWPYFPSDISHLSGGEDSNSTHATTTVVVSRSVADKAKEQDFIKGTENPNSARASKARRPAWANLSLNPLKSAASILSKLSLREKSLYKLAIFLQAASSLPRGACASGADLVVGFMDTGIDTSHEALNKHLFINPNEIAGSDKDNDGNGYLGDIHGFDFANNRSEISPGWHGTHVAGIIAGQAGKEIPPEVKLLPLKITDDSKSWQALWDTLWNKPSHLSPEDAETLVAVIKYAQSLNTKIINFSLGYDNFDQAVYDAIKDSGMLFVCSAGNKGRNTSITPHYPSDYDLPNVVSVAAMADNKLAHYSNFGGNVRIGAPGTVRSTLPGNRYGVLSGTSMAAPYVVNLLIHELAKNGLLTNDELISLLDGLPGLTSKEDMAKPNLLEVILQYKDGLVQLFKDNPAFLALTVTLYIVAGIRVAEPIYHRRRSEKKEDKGVRLPFDVQ